MCNFAAICLLFKPNERALLARAVKDGGGGRAASAAAEDADWNMCAVDRFLGNSSSSEGSRSWSTDDGNVDVELYRAEADDESYLYPLTPEVVVLPLPLVLPSALWVPNRLISGCTYLFAPTPRFSADFPRVCWRGEVKGRAEKVDIWELTGVAASDGRSGG